MDFGVITFATHDAMSPGDLGRLVEERGFHSLFFSDHTHIPASRKTPHPSGEALPRKYVHNLDVFVAVTAAAACTNRLRVGTGVCLVVERDPIITAKQGASIDTLSGGRFDFGVGAGWNREEMANHGTDPRTRMALMRERVESIKTIWTSHEASFHGDYVDFDQIWSYPKPLQRPHPSVLVGGNGPTVESRVISFGDGWLPTHQPDGEVIRRAKDLRDRADGPLQMVVQEVPLDPMLFEDYETAGFSRVLLPIASTMKGPTERALDRIEAAISDFQGP